MAIDIDGFVVLGAIASSPALFADIRIDVAKAARSLATKQLKTKTLNLEALKRIRGLLEQEQFSMLLDGLKDTELKVLAKKIDKNNSEVAAHNRNQNRTLLLGLADGSAVLAQKAVAKPKASKAKAEGKKKVTRAISSEAMAARWDGTNPDDPKK